jgi:P4 family phage/plasmid primase-like protien
MVATLESSVLSTLRGRPETKKMETPKEYALHYLQNLGFSVFPLRNEPASERKRPILSWESYQNRHPNVQEIESWFAFNPNYNLAIVTGSISKIVVLDIDGPNAAQRIASKIPEMSDGLRYALANTMKNRTGSGGEHVILRLTEAIDDITTRTLWREVGHNEIKLKGNGGYIATAPSIHPNGNKYVWNQKEPVVISKELLDEFIRLVGSPEPNKTERAVATASTKTSQEETRVLSPEQMEKLLFEVKPCYSNGSRNDIVYCLPAAMRREGLTFECARQFITLLCNAAEDSIEDRSRSMEKVNRTYSLPIEEINGKKGLNEFLVSIFGEREGNERFSRICQCINRRPNPSFLEETSAKEKIPETVIVKLGKPGDEGEEEKEEVSNQTSSSSSSSQKTVLKIELDESPGAWLSRQKQADSKLDEVATVCEEVLRLEEFRTYADTKDILWYNTETGTFVPSGENVIDKLIVRLCNYDLSRYDRNEIKEHIKIRTLTDRAEFDSNPNIINVQNGLLDIFTCELTSHTPDYPSTFQYPMAYDANTECPVHEKFLAEVIQDPHKLREFLKFWAYVLLKDCRYEKGAMFVGGGSNGKGTLIKLMEAQEGGFDKCSHVGLQEMGVDRFATASLFGKTLNTVADLEDGKIKSSGNIKLMISGDSLEGQFKHSPRFTFRNRAKFVYSANNPPESSDKSYAFYRRWEVWGFDRTFIVTDDVNDPNRKDPQLLEKLLTPQEMSGVLNLRLKYLQVLLKENGFDEQSFEVIKREYESRAEHVSRFLKERCSVDFTNFDTDCRTDTQTLYAEYLNWAKEANIARNVVLAENTFGSKLAESGIQKKDRKRKGEKRGYDYMHVKLMERYNMDGIQVEVLDESGVQATITKYEDKTKKPQTCQVCSHQLPSFKELQVHTIFRHPEKELATAPEEGEETPVTV